jgi:hypoxanthine phosphoribosyltransferase
MEIIINREQITQRVKDLAIQISQDHIDSGNAMPPVMICILNGAIHFFSDLTRAMTIDCEIDFLRLKSYEGQDNSGGIKCTKDIELELKGKRVYIVDDICDTGATLLEAIIMCNSRIAQEVKIVTLLNRREGVDLTDYCGFEIGDEFVVGYGLDNNGYQRELLNIYKLN